jgi:hypothetical protein
LTGARIPVSTSRSSFDRGAIVRPVGRAVRRSGAKVIEFNLFRPLRRPAFAVVVSSHSPARFIERRLARIISAFPEQRLDAYYVAVADARRKVVFAYSAVGAAAFTYYVRPDLVGCAKKLPIANEIDPEGIATLPVLIARSARHNRTSPVPGTGRGLAGRVVLPGPVATAVYEASS